MIDEWFPELLVPKADFSSTLISSEMICEVLVFVGMAQQYVISDNTYSPPPPPQQRRLPNFQSQ